MPSQESLQVANEHCGVINFNTFVLSMIRVFYTIQWLTKIKWIKNLLNIT